MSDIFISYARDDLERVRPLAQALDAHGWSVFWDRTIPSGKTWRQVIGKALDEAGCVLVVWSHASIESKWVQEEADEGLEREILVPVRIEDVKPPLGFRSIQGEDLFDWKPSDPSPAFAKLLRDIESIIGSPKAPPEEKPPPPGVPAREPKPATPQPGAVFRDTLKDGSDGPEMIVIPPGAFEMGDVWGDGDDREKPVHPVRIAKPFALGKDPVTFAEYDRFVKATSGELPRDNAWGRADRPVINVSWDDAVAYAEWLSEQTGKRYRLPSEAEWEYAARSGGKEEKWAGTSEEGELGDYAWHASNSRNQTHPVGEKKPNGLGLNDMSGNVYEWVQDLWHENYKGAPEDGTAWESGEGGRRVVRGGSWGDGPGGVRSATRSWYAADNRDGSLGFRLAQDLE